MKQVEKLDLILKELYKFRGDGHIYSLHEVCDIANIEIVGINEIAMLAKRLENDGHIKASYTFDDCLAEITSYGIEYCEEDSYTFKNEPLINNTYNLTITNSPNSNIVSKSKNTNITINSSIIETKIEEIKRAIEKENISDSTKENLLDCIEDIEIVLDSRKKKPTQSFQKLMELGSNISGITTLIIELGQLIM